MKIFFQGITSSNQTKKYGLQSTAFCYFYIIPAWGLIVVTKPFIDRLSVTVPVTNSALQDEIKAALLDVDQDSYGFFDPVNPANKSYYKVSGQYIDPPTKSQILVQADPKKKDTAHFLRLEFNPHELGGAGLKTFKKVLILLFNQAFTWADVVKTGRITRLDFAVDMINCPIAELVFAGTKNGKVHAYYGLGGQLETAYFGAVKKGGAPQKAYDKAQQAADADDIPLYNGTICTRIEITKRGNLGHLSNLPSVKNPFLKMVVCHPASEPPGQDPALWSFYLDSCRFRGIDAATQRLPTDLRAIFRERLLASHSPCWQPQKIWSKWSDVVEQSELLS